MKAKFISLNAVLFISFLILNQACEVKVESDKSNLQNIKDANQAYVDAWLENDSTMILATLTEDAVLIPHHGVNPIQGKEAIREFWFPQDSPPTKVKHISNEVSEILIEGDMAIVWGRSELEFVSDGKTYYNEGNYLNVLCKDGSNNWRIARRIWNDPMPEIN